MTHTSAYTQNQERLRQERNARHLEQSLSLPILIIDADFRLCHASAEAERLLGLEQQNLALGRPLSEILESGLAEIVYAIIRQAIQNRTMAEEPCLADRQILRLRVSPLFDHQDQLQEVLLLFMDETEACRAHLHAEYADRIKSVFLSRMSHELRTPLNAILGFTDILLEKYCGDLPPERQQDYLSGVRDSGRHLLEMIEDLLDISRIESSVSNMNHEEVSLCHSLHHAMETVQNVARQAEIQLDLQCQCPIPTIKADSVALQRIFTNLLHNAVKYTPARGHVQIRIQNSAKGVEISIHDTGIGIPADEQERIFQPFERGNRGQKYTQEGVGLGLSIAKSLILLHDGWIDLQSTVGKGTAVTVGFPPHRLCPPQRPPHGTVSTCKI